MTFAGICTGGHLCSFTVLHHNADLSHILPLSENCSTASAIRKCVIWTLCQSTVQPYFTAEESTCKFSLVDKL